jgi:hypothetical protein
MPPTLSQTQSITRGPDHPVHYSGSRPDAICAKTNTKLAAVTVITSKELARQLPQVVVYDATETNELSKLAPPTSLAHDWPMILTDLHQFTEYSRTVTKRRAGAQHEGCLPRYRDIKSTKNFGQRRCSTGEK